MKMLAKSENAKKLGDLTVVPIGFAVDVAMDISRHYIAKEAVESAMVLRTVSELFPDMKPNRTPEFADAVMSKDSYNRALRDVRRALNLDTDRSKTL